MRPLRVLDLARRFGLPSDIFGDDPADPYLLRIHLTPDKRWWRKRLPGVALNHFFRGDNDREYHNHPWRWSLSFVLTGGYTEYRKDGRFGVLREFIVRPGMLNVIWRDTFHRITLDNPEVGAWTLFIMAPRDWPDGAPSDWGFTTADGKTFEHQTEREARVKRAHTGVSS